MATPGACLLRRISKPRLAPVFAVGIAKGRLQHARLAPGTEHLPDHQDNNAIHKTGFCTTKISPAVDTAPNTYIGLRIFE